MLLQQESRAVLSQRGPRDAAVNFDTYIEVYSGIERFSCTAFELNNGINHDKITVLNM